MKLRSLAALGTLSLILTLAACGGNSESGDTRSVEDRVGGSLEEMVEAAQEEGKVVLYAGPDEAQLTALAKGFEAKYGIEVVYSRMVSGDVIQRYSSEASAGNVVADLTMQSSSAFVKDAIDEGWMIPLVDAEIPSFPGEWPEKFRVNEDGTVIATLVPFGIAYNTDLVSADEAPQDWEDLADDKWDGEILLSDPTSAPSYAGLFDRLLDEFGPELLKGIGGNVVRVNASMVPNLEALGAGEASVGVPSLPTLVNTAKAAGAPIEFVPVSYTTGTDFAVGLSADADHPDAARLLIHYMLFDEGQQLLNSVPGALSPLAGEEVAEYQRPRPESLQPERQAEMWKLMQIDSLS